MSKKRIALILSSLLGIFLISACILWHCSQSEDKRFEAFLSSFFCQELSGNSLTLHYTLKDPSAYGLEDVPLLWEALATTAQNMAFLWKTP